MEKAALKEIFAKGTIPAGTSYKAALTDVLQTFPYFQLAQMLLAKQMYNSHEPEASGRIKLASVYAPDRKAMYHLFKTADTTQASISPVTDSPKKSVDKPENTGVKYNYVYTSSTAKNTEVPHPEQKVDNKPPSPPKEEPIHTETFIRKESESKLPFIPLVEKTPQVDSANTEAQKPEPQKIDAPVVTRTQEKKAEQPILSLPVKQNHAIYTEPPAEAKKEPGKETIKPVADIAAHKEKDLTETTSTSLPNEPISDNNLKYSFSSWLKVIPEISIAKKEPIKPVNQQKTSDIIDIFLSRLPSISRPKAEFFSPVKAAKMSIIEDDTIVSETLAKIYFEQGNLQKALNAYQALLTEFPEKKNIFAPRIEKIKALMRENNKPATK